MKSTADLYNEGHTLAQVAALQGSSVWRVLAELKRSGVTRRPVGLVPREDTLIAEIFKPRSERAAYALGLLAADGHVGIPKNGRSTSAATICVHAQDVDVLRRLAEVYAGRVSVYGNSATYLSPVSVSVQKNAMSVGMAGPKTATVQLLRHVPENLKRHALRGYFDGDGCVVSWTGRRMITLNVRCVFVSGSVGLLDEIQQFLEEHQIDTRRIRRKSTAEELIVSKVDSVLRFRSLLYDGATWFFARKERKLAALLEYRAKCAAQRRRISVTHRP